MVGTSRQRTECMTSTGECHDRSIRYTLRRYDVVMRFVGSAQTYDVVKQPTATVHHVLTCKQVSLSSSILPTGSFNGTGARRKTKKVVEKECSTIHQTGLTELKAPIPAFSTITAKEAMLNKEPYAAVQAPASQNETQQIDGGLGANESDRVKAYLFLKRRDGITREEFLNYWKNDHRQNILHLHVCKSLIKKVEQVSFFE